MTARRSIVLDPHDDAVRMLEVLDRRALAQELRIGDDREPVARQTAPAMIALDLVARVPIGTVDFTTTTVKSSITSAISRAAS